MTTNALTTRQRAQLDRFAAAVETSPHNLVSRRARAELATRHIPECVALAGLLPAGRQRLLDLGSGGGLPGMVLAVVRPDLDVHLLESTHKKVRFLRTTATELEVAVTVHEGRAEHLAVPPLVRSFDLVTARAVAPLARLVPWAIPFLAPTGILYAVKGERWREELDEAAPVLHRVRARVLATPDDAALPAGDAADEVEPRVVMIGRSD